MNTQAGTRREIFAYDNSSRPEQPVTLSITLGDATMYMHVTTSEAFHLATDLVTSADRAIREQMAKPETQPEVSEAASSN